MDNNQSNMDFYTPEGNGNTSSRPPVNPQSGNGMSVAAMVVGIVTAVLGWCCCPYLAVVSGIAGIVLACLSRKGQKMNGKALTGLICSIVGIVGGIVSIVLTPLLTEYLEEVLKELGYELETME